MLGFSPLDSEASTGGLHGGDIENFQLRLRPEDRVSLPTSSIDEPVLLLSLTRPLTVLVTAWFYFLFYDFQVSLAVLKSCPMLAFCYYAHLRGICAEA